ncbi:F-box/FBD/LRR protein [Rhynchospora pubera]|uniref:F-box/FBD/LRR protein n=1 Tax=Rhynchospora pubera TaxID=906938 RepID=A0AAV8G3U9_9POAL|nr:F-box/FBD/LRR protein [Rhynchospora pubera]
MYSFQALNFFKGKCNSSSSLIILTIVPAVSFLLYKKIIVAFWPHFLVRKNKLSIASSLFEEEVILGGKIVFNLPEFLKQDIYDADIICNHPECIEQDTSSVDVICNLLECINEDVLDTDIIGKLPECAKQDISGADIICNLPECIKHKILVYLPLKEAVRTSILSKDWRYTWTGIPNLVIDCNIDQNLCQNNGDNEKSTIDKFIDQLFSCHKGNLHKFRISNLKTRMLLTSPLMRILSQRHIKELILEAFPDQYILILGIERCLELKVLVLSDCYIDLPLKFDGFKLLQTIELRDSRFFDKGIADLLSFCPVLEKLTFKLQYCDKQIIIIDSRASEN